MSRHEITYNVVCATSKASDQPAAYAQSDQNICWLLEYSMTDHHLEFVSLKKGVCTGSTESTHIKMPHCWKSRVAAHMKNTHNKISLSVTSYINCSIARCSIISRPILDWFSSFNSLSCVAEVELIQREEPI